MASNGHITLFEATQLLDVKLNQNLVKAVVKDNIGIRDANGVINVDPDTFENWVERRRLRGLGAAFDIPDGYVAIVSHIRKEVPAALHNRILNKGAGTLSTDFLALLNAGALPTARKAGGRQSPWIAQKDAINAWLVDQGYLVSA